jgi:hypothetical protein
MKIQNNIIHYTKSQCSQDITDKLKSKNQAANPRLRDACVGGTKVYFADQGAKTAGLK